MKKILSILSAVVILLAACQTKDTLLPIERVAQGDPIKPIQVGMDSAIIFVTDFVPTLAEDGFDNIWLDDHQFSGTTKVLRLFMPNIFYSQDRFQLHTLTFVKDGKSLSVPILPIQPRKQAMYGVSCDKQQLIVRFTQMPENPRFALYWQNNHLGQVNVNIAPDGAYCIDIPQIDVKKKGRSFLRLFAADDNYTYNDLLIPLQDMKPVSSTRQLTRHDHEAQVLYSLMIDRFENGNYQNDWKIDSEEVLDIVDYQGGDIAGITKKICEGFFDELGVNTLWISPITQNPWDAWGMYIFEQREDDTYNNKYDPTRAYTKFSGYHGYWPIYATQIDKRFGTDKELHQMLREAHKHNINVVLDYVANHMHINSPTLQAHPDWHTDSILPDGRRNFELWDDARLTTWFDRHIPTLDLERKEVYEAMTDSALHWLDQFEFDGFRHDACKHIPEVYWRTLTQKMKTRHEGRPLWMIGETYGDPKLIGSYVKTGMLDAQFDFNVFFTAQHAIAEQEGDMRDVESVIEQSLAAYGSHHTMGNISGNHDQIRFISLAGGDISFDANGKEEGWTREVGVGNEDIAYRKATLLEVLNLTIPGVPCIYQGDEYGQPGGNDPDNRHMMRFGGLNEHEQAMRTEVSSLIKQRRNSMALIYGEYLPVMAEQNLLVFKRIYMGEQILVAINTSGDKQQVEVDEETLEIEPYGYIIRHN